MSQATLSSSVVREVSVLIYHRRVVPGALYINGETDGWTLDRHLRCEWISNETGSRVGSAQITYVPIEIGHQAQAVERVLSRYSPDDQVRVVVVPADDELQPAEDDGASATPGVPGVCLFEGIMGRAMVGGGADATENTEGVAWRAQHIATHDNRASDHVILGRWVLNPAPADVIAPQGEEEDAEDAGATPVAAAIDVISGLCVPAVANVARKSGRARNRSPQTVTTADGAITFHPFTHDDDPAGEVWTARQLLLSIIGQWLHGSTRKIFGTYVPYNLHRTFAIDPETLAALQREPGDEADGPYDESRWVGLNNELPEVNVHGLGVLDAIGEVARHIGFDFAVVPAAPQLMPAGDEDEEATERWPDRPWMAKLWRRNSGVIVWPRLATRGTSYASVEDAYAGNDFSKFNLMRDHSEIVNEIFAVGRTYIETAFPLLPLWPPADVDPAPLSSDLQTATAEQLAGEGYHAKHVDEGSLIDEFGHVGRLWGLDCAGGFAGYPDGDYKHDPEGFDFVGYLGINDNPDERILKWRRVRGFNDPFVWTRRVRHILPLRHPEARRLNLPWVVEVSEDGGETWSYYSKETTTLPEAFGLRLDNLPNLAAVNLASIKGGEVPSVEESWWALIQTGMLRFRVTCAIEADHGFQFNAYRKATSGSAYHFGALVNDASIIESWRGPNHWFAPGVTWWVDMEGWDLALDEADNLVGRPVIDDVANARRDYLEGAAVSGTLSTWIMDLRRYELGQRVGGIRGRALSFAVSAGTTTRHPNIVGLTYSLAAGAQHIQMTLDDHRLAAGRR